MSELHERFSAYELRERYVAEHYWPVGHAAENWRARLIGLIVAQRISFSRQTQEEIERIEKMLDGTFDPEKDMPHKGIPPPEQMEQEWY